MTIWVRPYPFHPEFSYSVKREFRDQYVHVRYTVRGAAVREFCDQYAREAFTVDEFSYSVKKDALPLGKRPRKR